jgi:ubiquinone/menaquinone biosynthesis C-methylase UbiE
MTKLQDIYDEFATTYELNRGLFDMTNILNDFYDNLSTKKGKLLDLGCGAGEPFDRFFIDKGWSVVGVDFSKKMLELANKYVPEMTTIHSDISKINFADNEFDAVILIYSLFHLTNEEQIKVLEKIYEYLTPNGMALFTYATKEYTKSDEFDGYKEFLGKNLYYAHKTPEFFKNKLESIGFKLKSFDYRDIAGEVFLWVTVQK